MTLSVACNLGFKYTLVIFINAFALTAAVFHTDIYHR